MQILRRRNARRVVAYRWDEVTGIARLRWEGEGGPPATEEVFHGACWMPWAEREQMREQMRKEKSL